MYYIATNIIDQLNTIWKQFDFYYSIKYKFLIWYFFIYNENKYNSYKN